MTQKQRELIVQNYIMHLDNGHRGDPAGAYNDIRDFFRDLINTDEKLKEMADDEREEWENK
jgi:hypothetical protein